MRRVIFYRTVSGRCPVQEHLDMIPDRDAQKVAWVLRVVRDLERVPSNFLKKLIDTDDIWEIRADLGRNAYRLLGFLEAEGTLILTQSFQKKGQETPKSEIRLAEERKADYLKRSEPHGRS